MLPGRPRIALIDEIAANRRRWDAVSEPLLASREMPINPFRITAELNRQVAALRAELEKQLRRSVREAVEHALAARTPPTKEP